MIEQFIYESRPFAYLATSFTAFMYAPNRFTNGFAALLAASMFFILYWRYQNRVIPPSHRLKRDRP